MNKRDLIGFTIVALINALVYQIGGFEISVIFILTAIWWGQK